MIRTVSLAIAPLAALSLQALAEPPSDIEGCIQLSADTARAANVNTEAKYVKFHTRLMDLDMACGQRDYATAQKISDEIKATFPPDK